MLLVRDGYFPEERCKMAHRRGEHRFDWLPVIPLRLNRFYSLPVIKQNLLAGFTDFRPILLEAGENRQVSF
jgi:hypothetical protein